MVRATVENEGLRAAEEVPLSLIGHALPPFPSTLISVILASDLQPGDSMDLETLYFGESDWRMTPVQSSLSRGEDTVETDSTGESTTTQTYTLERTLPSDREVSRLQVTPGGLLLHMETTSANGTWTATLRAGDSKGS